MLEMIQWHDSFRHRLPASSHASSRRCAEAYINPWETLIHFRSPISCTAELEVRHQLAAIATRRLAITCPPFLKRSKRHNPKQRSLKPFESSLRHIRRNRSTLNTQYMRRLLGLAVRLLPPIDEQGKSYATRGVATVRSAASWWGDSRQDWLLGKWALLDNSPGYRSVELHE
jgi:hypothetical protein